MKSKIIAGSIVAAILVAGILVGLLINYIQRQNLISDAQTFFDQGKYPETIDRLQSSIEGGKTAPSERLLIAESYYRLRQFDRAQEALDPLLRVGQENARALALSGWLWIKENSPLQAQTRFEKAAKMGLTAEAEGGMGAVALLQSEDYRSAYMNVGESQLKKSISLDPTNPKVFLVLSEMRRLQHEYDEAIELAKKAVNLAPCWSEPHAMIGRIYLILGNHAEAEKAFTESQKYGGSKEETQYYLAQSVYYQGRFSEALSLLEELITNGKDKVKDALTDAARIMTITNNPKALEYLKRSWSIKADPLTGMQYFEILSRQGKQEEAAAVLKDVIASWPFLSLAQLELGHMFLKENDINRAYSSYQSVLDQDEKNYWANFNLGCLAPLRNDFNQAPEFFKMVVREYEDYFPAQVNLIFGQLALDQNMDAENSLVDLLSRYPDNSYLLLARAMERFAAGDSTSALDFVERSLKNGQKPILSYIIQGEIMLRLFQFEKALVSFTEALRIDEKNSRALLGKAHTLYRLGDFTKAEECYQQLYDTLSSLSELQQAETQNGLALTAMERSEQQKSQEIWDKLKRSNQENIRQFSLVNRGLIEEEAPSSSLIEDLKVASMSRNVLPEVFYNLAVFLDVLDRRPEAIESYENLVRRYPGYLPGLFNLANLYSVEGRKGDSIALYDRAQEGVPQRADVLNNQATVYASLERFDRARERLDQAEAIDANLVEIKYNKLLATLQEGKIEEAKKLSDQFETASAYSALSDMALGLVRMAENRWKEAETALAQAKKREPQNAYVCLNHGICLAKLHQHREAQIALKEAVQTDPSLAGARRSLGLLYCEMGLYDLAEPELKAAIQLDSSQTDLNGVLEQIQKWIGEINPSNP